MLRRTLVATALAGPALAACATPTGQSAALGPLPLDDSSYARPSEARVRHVSLDLRADFARRRMTGSCTLSIVARPDAREIVLDAHRLVIDTVRTNLGEAAWALGAHDEEKGAPLSIAIAPGVTTIRIVYASSEDARALQWLAPAQTASGKPFLFSQGQAINNRTWIPTQDSPGIRQTYDARIVAPDGLRAVMSAEMSTPNGQPAEGGRAFRFRMPQPIPPYLIAVAIGELEHRAVGPRTGVYAEPSVVAAAAWEFADMENMMRVAEALYGRYRWGRYDVLVLPPSFPYGGMENPRLTFATPTAIAGDRSLVSLVAHELAHSWSGNLVTNAVWADSWLNEGFTSYIEARIGEELFGVEMARMAAVLSWADVQRSVGVAPPDAQRLHSISDIETPSAIVYDKGALFLHTIEGVVGRGALDSYLRSYFDRHAFQPMTTEWFLADFRERVVRGDAALEARLMLDQWAYEPGLPSNAVEPHAAGFDEVDRFVVGFGAGGDPGAAPWSSWVTMQRQRYLQTLPRQLPRARLDALEQAFDLNDLGNSEVLFDWLALAVRNGYEPAGPSLENFLMRQGRGKFVRPLYRALMDQGPWGQALARRVYAAARPTYHPLTAAAVDRIMNPA